jgi:hypothetical protein
MVGDSGNLGIAVTTGDTAHNGAWAFIAAERKECRRQFSLIPSGDSGAACGTLTAGAVTAETSLSQDDSSRRWGLRIGTHAKRA